MINNILNNVTIKQSGNINTNSETHNNVCSIINDLSNGFIYGISGLIPFNDAIRRTNDHNLNKKQLYNLYINKNIKQLAAINFGEYFKDLSTNPTGREVLVCLDTTNLKDIKLVINNNNYKNFTDVNYVKEKYPNLLKNPSNPQLGLTNENNKILNKFIYNNMFKNISKKKIFTFLLNNHASTNKIIGSQFSAIDSYCNRNRNINNNPFNINLN